jgi:hypothetical protein
MNPGIASELKKEAEESSLPRLAMVHNLLEICQGSQNLRATQKKSCAECKQMATVGYISDYKDSVKGSW